MSQPARPMPLASDALTASVLEDILIVWLQASPFGKDIVADMGFEQALDSIWELLNVGMIKLIADGDWFYVRPCCPPEPPLMMLERPARRAGGDG